MTKRKLGVNPLTPADIVQFLAGVENCTTLGKKLGVSNTTTMKWLREMGVDTSDKMRSRRHRTEDLSGRVFDKLTVVKPCGFREYPSGVRVPLFECRCECGATVVKDANSLKLGRVTVCGPKCRCRKTPKESAVAKIKKLMRKFRINIDDLRK